MKRNLDGGPQSVEILSRGLVSRMNKHGFFNGYNFTPKKGKLYFRTRAISARVNRNYDAFPSEELKQAHKTFVGRPYFVNHNNINHRRTRGIIIDSKFLENKKDKYIELIIEADAQAFPKLAEELSKGNLDGVSMGTDVKKTICSYCNNEATSPEEFCDHVLYAKGQILERISSRGEKEAVLVYEICRGLNFFEISSVFDPADETALIQEVLLPQGSSHQSSTQYQSSTQKHSFGETVSPPHVDTLRQEEDCPQCGDASFNGMNCPYCGFNAPPSELADPDLQKAQQEDLRQEQNSSQLSIPDQDPRGLDQQNLNGGDNMGNPLNRGDTPEDDDQGYEQGVNGQEAPDENVLNNNSQDDDLRNDGSQDYSDGGEWNGSDYSDESSSPEEVAQEASQLSVKDQIKTLQDQLDSLQDQLFGDSDDDSDDDNNDSDVDYSGEEDDSRMPSTQARRVQMKARQRSAAEVKRRETARLRLEETRSRLSDLSENVTPGQGAEAIADTPSPESSTDSTDSERNDEEETNVQDLDANPSTREEEMKPDEREDVEVPVRPVAKRKPSRTITPQEFDLIFNRSAAKYSTMDLGTGLAKAAYDFAQFNKLDAKSVVAQILTSATKRLSELTLQDRRAVGKMTASFRNRLAVDDDETKKNNDVLDMLNDKDNLEVAKPDDTVDVEKPVANDTDDEAQDTQFEPSSFDNNAGDKVAEPDDVSTMNWAPGEKPSLTSNVVHASAVDAIKLAETYIELGVFSPDLKFDKIAVFEKMPKIVVQEQQRALDAVKRTVASRADRPRGVVPQAVAGRRPIPQMGRAASLDAPSTDEAVFLAC